VLALLMVSTLRFHGVKEIDFRERKPFWVLIVFVLILFVFLIHASSAMFIFAMVYLVWGIIENSVLVYKKMRTAREEKQTGA
jgi:CDP-diacylglycerol--serine O-phosphatidyltransferase